MSKYGNKDINKIIELFTAHMGIAPTPLIRQRQYAHSLTKLFGDKTLDVVKFAISIQQDYYAPRITNPKDLFYKASKVMDYYRKHTNNERVGKA